MDSHAHSDSVGYLSAFPHLATVFGAFSSVPLVSDGRGTEKGFTTKIRIEVHRHLGRVVEHACTVGILLLVSIADRP